MKKIKFLAGLVLVLALVFSANQLFKNSEVKAQDDEKPAIYIHGAENKYQRNGLLAFSSQEDPVISVSGYNLKTEKITVDVFKADMNDFLKFLVYDDENKQINPKVSLENKEKIGTFEVKSDDNFELPSESQGVFVVHAHSDEAEVFSFVIRSNTGVVFKEGKNSLIVWTQNLETKKKIPNQSVTFYNLKQKVTQLESYKTNYDGLTETKLSDRYDVAVVGNGDDLAFVKLNLTLNSYYNSFNPEQGLKNKYFLFTDRTLYKPGDMLYFKAILRNDDDINYLIPSGQWKVSIDYWDKKRMTLAEKIFTVNDFGTLSGEFKIPEDVKTGVDFTLTVERAGQKNENSNSYFYDYYGTSEAYFSVENYRKPEYTLNVDAEETELNNKSKITFNVEGKYFSGQPLSGEKVEYVIRSRDFYNSTFYDKYQLDHFRSGYGGGSYGNQLYKGIVELDAEGKGQVLFDADVADGVNKIYSIELNYASEVGENVKAQKNVLVFAAEYGIYREDYRWSFNLNEEVKINLALKESQKEVDLSHRKIKITPQRIWWEENKIDDGRDRYHYNYIRHEEVLDGFEVETDSQGKTQVSFNPDKPGSYKFFASSEDSQGNMTNKQFSFWVSDKEKYSYSDHAQSLVFNLNKVSYKPGEKAEVTISSNIPDRDVLFSVDRDFTHEYRVVSLDGNSKQIEIPSLNEYMPSMSLSAVSFSDNNLDSGYAKLEVSAESEKLNVAISTDKDIYGAGDEVTATIKTTDQDGNPQSAEVALWTIDKAILELTSSSSKDAFGYFWNYRSGYTESVNSLEEFGINMAEHGGGGGGGPERSIFKDTAYWESSIRTNKNGESQVSFKLPDDLTTWVFSAIAVTKDTKLGNATHEITVTQPVILRPQLPNFLYSDDEATIYVDAQNFSGEKRSFVVKAEFDGGEVENSEQIVEIENGETVEVAFTISPKEERETKISFSISPIIELKDKLSKEETDEIRAKFSDKITKTLLIEKFGFLEKTFSTHKNGEEIQLQINDDALNEKTKVELEIASSLVGSLPSAMEYILDYHYGCVEQTTSRFSVALKVKQNPEYFSQLTEDRDIDAILQEGVERLNKMQNSDGGWGWMTSSEKKSSPFISIYVVESLLEAKNSGVAIDENVLNKAKNYFLQYDFDYFQEPDINKLERKIVVFYGRGLFGVNSPQIEIVPELEPDMLAFGVITNKMNGFSDSNLNGMNFIKSTAKKQGDQQFWQKGDYYRFGSVDGSTALCLRALMLEENADKNLIEDVVRYLSNSRKNSYWSNTFATSQVIKALSEYADKYENNKGNKDIKVYLDGKNILSERLNVENPFANIVLYTDEISQNSVLKVNSTDDVYINLVKKEFRTGRNAEALSNGITIEKTYNNQNNTGKIGKGDIVDVEIKISGLNRDSMAYLVVDDKLPAGLVPINKNLANAVRTTDGKSSYAYPEYEKGGVVFYKEYINYDTLVFRYQAKAVSSGNFIVPPTTAELMYNPDVYARTGVNTLTIEAEPQKDNSRKEIGFTSDEKLIDESMNFLDYLKKNTKKIFIAVIFIAFTATFTYIIRLVVRDWKAGKKSGEEKKDEEV